MTTQIKIPKGYRKLREGTMPKRGDMLLMNERTGRMLPVVRDWDIPYSEDEIAIRRIKPRKKGHK